MTCKHFGTCGSCGLYELSYQEQLQQKEERVSSLLAPFYRDELEMFDSPDSHYRARSEFRIWHEGERCDYAMGNIEKKGAVTIEECPKVIEPIEKRMWKLLEKIDLRHTGREFSLRKCLEECRVDIDRFGLVECADKVFTVLVVDTCLTADTGIDLAQKCRRDLDEIDPALIEAGREPCHIAYDPAAECDKQGFSVKFVFKEFIQDRSSSSITTSTNLS